MKMKSNSKSGETEKQLQLRTDQSYGLEKPVAIKVKDEDLKQQLALIEAQIKNLIVQEKWKTN